MNLLLRIDINIVAIFVLGALLLNTNIYKEKNNFLNRLFVYIILFTMTELVLETLTCVINHRTEAWVVPLAKWLHVVLFSLGPPSVMLWCLFVDYWVYHNKVRIRNIVLIFLIPLVFNAVISFASPFTGSIFTILSGNIYQRGPLFFVPVVITYLFLLYSFIFIMLNRRRIRREEFYPLLLFSIPPSIGGLIQALFYGFLLIWSSMAFTILVVYIYLQQRMIHVDAITGAWTRRKLDSYLEYRINAGLKANDFSAILLDLDNFKAINDQCGHMEGDRALREVVETVQSCLRKEDSIARYGGDEFIIILEIKSKEELKKAVKRIEESIKRYNETANKPYLIEFSCGYDLYKMGSKMTVEQFLEHIDSLMYKAKQEKIQNKS